MRRHHDREGTHTGIIEEEESNFVQHLLTIIDDIV